MKQHIYSKLSAPFFILLLIWCYRMPPSIQFLRSDKPFFLKTFLAGLLFFLFDFQTVTITCIKKALKSLQNEKTVVSLTHQTIKTK